MVLTLGTDDIEQLQVYIDASHAIHGDAKSPTGMIITMGKECCWILARQDV